MIRILSMVAVVALATGCGSTPSTGAPAGSTPGAAGTMPAASLSTAPTTPSPPVGPVAAASRYVFPVAGNADYHHTHAIYPATDIFARCGAPVRSPVSGVVLEVNRADTFVKAHPAGAAKGGRFVSVRGDDGVRYYGSHLTRVTPGLAAGQRIVAGAPWGTLGRSGNANGVCHLHFALSPPCAGTGDWWIRRGVVYPWPYLDAWRRGVASSPAAAVATWLARHGCGARGLPDIAGAPGT